MCSHTTQRRYLTVHVQCVAAGMSHSQIPKITVLKETGGSLNCYEGEKIVLIASASTDIEEITQAGFTFTWSTAIDDQHGELKTSTSDPAVGNNKGNVFSYECTVADTHTIYVAATALGQYAVNSEAQTSFKITVNNGKIKDASATFTALSLVPDADGKFSEPVLVSFGDEVTLTFTFTDASLSNIHTFKVDWDDGSTTPSVTNELSADKRTFTATHVYSPAAGDTSKVYTVTTIISDDAQVPQVQSTGGTSTQLQVSRQVTFKLCVLCDYACDLICV